MYKYNVLTTEDLSLRSDLNRVSVLCNRPALRARDGKYCLFFKRKTLKKRI